MDEMIKEDFSKDFKKIKLIRNLNYVMLILFFISSALLLLAIFFSSVSLLFKQVFMSFWLVVIMYCLIKKVSVRCPRCNEPFFYKTPIMTAKQKQGPENHCRNCGLKIN